MADEKDSNAIAVPFVFVRHGDPLPVEWMARHPGWVRFPATLVPRPVPRQVVPGAAWDVAGAGEPSGFGPTSRPVSVGAPVVQRRRVPVHRLPTGRRDAEDPVAAYLRISKAMDGAASAYLAAERTRAAPKALSTSPEGLPPPLTAAATAGSAGGGRAQAGVGGGRRSPAASDMLDLWTGTGVADIAGAVMADAGPVGPATAKADAPAAPVHIDVAPNGVEHGATGDAAAVAGSDQATKADTVFSPGREGYHSYQAGPYIVAPAYMHVTPEEMADQMSRFAVPGQSPDKPVESGQTYLVFIPDSDVPVGIVRTTISSNGLMTSNRTLPLHILYDGQITRTATQNPDGSWSVTTIGTGNNVLPGAASMNKRVGPDIFNGIDEKMRQNIAEHHGAQ